MKEFEDRIPEVVIDRLVDGELAPEEQRQLLRSLEGEKDGWRRCALAFLEARAWSKHLGVLVDNQGDQLPQIETRRSQHNATSVNRLGWFLITAACAVMAFSLGLNSQPSRNVMRPMVVDHTQSRNPDQAPTLAAATAGQGYHPDFWERGSSMPESLTEWLKDHGIEVSTVRGLTSGMNQYGDPILVPYEDVKLQPVRHTAY